MYSNGSYNPSPGNGPRSQMNLQQNHVSHTILPPPPPQVQQGHPTGYMYQHPPPPASSASHAQLMSGATQSYSHTYPTSHGETQSTRGTSQQFHCPSSGQYHLPPVSMLPPPPPLPPPPLLPPGTMPPMQALPSPYHLKPSFPQPIPSRNLELPGMPLPPPPPRSSLPLVADTTCEKTEVAEHVCENVSFSGRVVDHEGPAVEGDESLKESAIHCESSPAHEKAEHGSPLCNDPDIEMEDDITLPENENHTNQPVKCDSDQVRGAYLNKEQLTPQCISPETNSLTNIAAEIPGSKSYAQVHQDTDDGSRQASSSPYSGKAKAVPESSRGDMYDPFLDSFEPTSNLDTKLDRVQEQEPANDPYIVPKESISSNRPLNIEENNQDVDKQAPSESDMTTMPSVSSNKPPEAQENIKGNDTEAALISGDNDEFGENVNSCREEGNSHETGTPNSNTEISKANNGENTAKKSRDNTKEKESRSMKLFKVVLTKFVKDLLKPSWRQGNMSKEAFKTIVKRAVEKVSNSMEGRRIPKSRAKIDRYIDSSRHKLTKLVMGYVDKYVKA